PVGADHRRHQGELRRAQADGSDRRVVLLGEGARGPAQAGARARRRDLVAPEPQRRGHIGPHDACICTQSSPTASGAPTLPIENDDKDLFANFFTCSGRGGRHLTPREEWTMSISNVLRASFSVGCVVLAAAAVAIPAPARSAEPVAEVRLYALDCGAADLKDMSFFSDTGEYDGKAGSVVVPYFVVRHPKGTLMWDTGLGDKLAETKGGADVAPGIHARVDHPLMEQLKALGLTPADVTFVAFSHFHFDHTGNANAFAASTWIVNKAEAAWAQGPNPPGVAPESISALKTVKTQMIDGDHDVFGDGTVRILRTPGHTPGHQVLMVKLAKS